jgi:hypothetical protein
MSRTLFDSVNPDAIPADATLALGYVDGNYPTVKDGALARRLPHATIVTCATNPAHDADVLDVERGDATPMQAPDWIVRQRRRGSWVHPTIYCDFSTWPQVEAAVSHLPRPAYIIADYDNQPTIPASWVERGCVAKQYRSDTQADLDYTVVIDDSWHPSASPTPTTPEEAFMATDTDRGGLVRLTFLAVYGREPTPDEYGVGKIALAQSDNLDAFVTSVADSAAGQAAERARTPQP